MVPYGVVSKSIILIQEGTVEMFYKNSRDPLLIYEDGSYVGEISLLFNVRNLFRFIVCPEEKKKVTIYSI